MLLNSLGRLAPGQVSQPPDQCYKVAYYHSSEGFLMSHFNQSVTRRNLVLGAAGASLYATLPGVAAAAAQRSFVPDFSDPVEALRAHVKLVGSLAKETVVSFYRLNIYSCWIYNNLFS